MKGGHLCPLNANRKGTSSKELSGSIKNVDHPFCSKSEQNNLTLEMVQRRSARYCTNRYHNTSSVTDMLQDLNWETLESRRTKLQLVMIYKIMNDLVDIPADTYLTPATTRTRAIHSKKLRQYPTRTDTFKYSFFPRTIPVWNSLPASVAEAPDLALFKQGLTSLSF